MKTTQKTINKNLKNPKLLETYNPNPKNFLDPHHILTQNIRDITHLNNIINEQTKQNITLPKTFIQPTP